MTHRELAFRAARRTAGGTLSQREVDAIDAALDAVGVPRPPSQIIRDEPNSGFRHINLEGLRLIKESEGLRLDSYRDPVGILTVGYGSTGPHVKEGMRITLDAAEMLLKEDLRRFERCVQEACPKATDNQFAAMVSLAFNIGCDAFKRSTLVKLHNQGKHRLAQAQFARWIFAKGRKLPGLVTRRAREAKLYGKAD